MNKHRIEVLRDFLLTAPIEDRFDLRSWAGNDSILWEGNPNLSCGTSACAVGWATTIPEFAAAGLCLTGCTKDFPGEAGLVFTDHDDDNHDEYHSFQAVQKFFDLDYDPAQWAFTSEAYDQEANATPKDVAERLQSLLDNDGRVPDQDYLHDPYDHIV